MKHRNRLKSYKKNAALGKLDHPCVVTEQIVENANNAIIPKDSVQTETGMNSQSPADHVDDVERCRDCMKELRMVARNLFNLDIELIVLADTERGKFAATAFNPHFKKCGCEDCRHNVAQIKKMVDEYAVFE